MSYLENRDFKHLRDNYQLPEFGNDWLEGMQDMYIILSLKMSTPEVTMFWRSNDCGYTDSLVNAGRYHKWVVENKQSYYNDGVNTIAVPLTRDALCTLGLYPIVADYSVVEQFYSRRINKDLK